MNHAHLLFGVNVVKHLWWPAKAQKPNKSIVSTWVIAMVMAAAKSAMAAVLFLSYSRHFDHQA